MPETQINPEHRPVAIPERSVETPLEVSVEHSRPAAEVRSETPTPIPPLPTTSVVPLDAVPPQTPELVRQVEHILSDGLQSTYQQLDPTTQTKFKAAGETTAVTISTLLQDAKDQTRKILQLIMAWLRIIPGVNQFFLEQEAKIKADQLLRLRHPQ